MSIIRAIKLRLGLSVTPANNFALTAEADNGTMKLARENGQDIMTVDANGKVVFPQNTRFGFLATTVVDPSNLLPSDGITKLKYENIVRQIGSGYSNSTHTFTAPVSGVYMFAAAGFTHRDAVAPVKSIRLILSTSAVYLLESLGNDSASGRCMGAMPIYLNAGETVYAAYYHNEAGVNLFQGWNGAISYFTGYLIG
jgi:hypothetical protein